jgi:aspartate aminotransferase-like enzyme
VSLFYALDAQMAAIGPTGIECRWARHAAMASVVHAWVEGHRKAGRLDGILAACGSRSATVTVVKTVGDARALVKQIAERGMTVGGGYGPLAATTFRIGHMGDHTVETIQRLLTTIDAVLG